MTEAPPFDPALFGGLDLHALKRVVDAKQRMDWAGTCSHPIRLVGGRDVLDSATGELLDSTGEQQITVSCGNRRASVCGYCSTLYKFDAYNLVAAGLRGGKDVPATVAGHPPAVRHPHRSLVRPGAPRPRQGRPAAAVQASA